MDEDVPQRDDLRTRHLETVYQPHLERLVTMKGIDAIRGSALFGPFYRSSRAGGQHAVP
jgi:hypothetical protein